MRMLTVPNVKSEFLPSNPATETPPPAQTATPTSQTRDHLETDSTQNEPQDTNCFMRCVNWIYDGLVYIWRCICCRSQPTPKTNNPSRENQTPQPQTQPVTAPPTKATEPSKTQIISGVVKIDIEVMKRFFPKEWDKITPAPSAEDHAAFAKLANPASDERFYRYYLKTAWYQALSWHTSNFEKLEPDIKAQLFCDLVRTTPRVSGGVPIYLEAVKNYALSLGPKLNEILEAYGSVDVFIKSIIPDV